VSIVNPSDNETADLANFASSLWQSIIVFGTELHGTSPNTVRQSSKFLVASICYLPDVTNCQFCEFTAAFFGPVHFLSGIHCLIICMIQLLTPNSLDKTWRRICLPDIQSVSALEVFTLLHSANHIYSRTYWWIIQRLILMLRMLLCLDWVGKVRSSGRQLQLAVTVVMQTVWVVL